MASQRRGSGIGCLTVVIGFVVVGVAAGSGGNGGVITLGVLFVIAGAVGVLTAAVKRPGGATATARSSSTTASPGPVARDRERQAPARTTGDHVPPVPLGAPIEPWGASTIAIEVVGEAYRPDAFLTIFQGLPVRGPDGAELELPAALVPDPANPYDRTAVAVRAAGQHVGYLDRDTARFWHPHLASLAAEGHHLVVPARLWAAHRGDRVNARVTIWVPRPDQIQPANALPTEPHVILPTGSTIQVTREEDHMDVLAKWAKGSDAAVAVTLRAIHEMRARSSFETVEVHLDGERVGILTPQQAANMLPVVKYIEARRLVPVARATLRGNALKADVTLHVAKSQDVDHEWLATLGPELPPEPHTERAPYEWGENPD